MVRLTEEHLQSILKRGSVSIAKTGVSIPTLDQPIRSEAEEQKAVVSWFRGRWPQFSRCIRLSLNGVPLPTEDAPKIINSFKAQGLTPGESDLAFLVPTPVYHGLLIEMKSTQGKPTKDQLAYLAFMEGLGYRTAVCKGAGEAVETIEDYMSGRGP